MTYTDYFHYLIIFFVCVGIVYCCFSIYRLSLTKKKDLLEAYTNRKKNVSPKGNLLFFLILILFFILSLIILSVQREERPNVNIYIYYFTLEALSFLLFFKYRKTKINNKLKFTNIFVKTIYLWPIFFVNSDVLYFIPLFSGAQLMIFFLLVAKNDQTIKN